VLRTLIGYVRFCDGAQRISKILELRAANIRQAETVPFVGELVTGKRICHGVGIARLPAGNGALFYTRRRTISELTEAR